MTVYEIPWNASQEIARDACFLWNASQEFRVKQLTKKFPNNYKPQIDSTYNWRKCFVTIIKPSWELHFMLLLNATFWVDAS